MMYDVNKLNAELVRADSVPSIGDRLQMRKDALVDELRKIDKALEALERNPEVAEVVQAISKLGHL